jgi:hypothetical protein
MAPMLVCVVGVACTEQSTSENTVKSTAPVLRVAVFADGRITADGSVTTIESLRESLKRLAELKGTVWYYREAGHAEPPPHAMMVMQAAVDNRLPIKLSTKPDYSDAVGPDGRPAGK